MAKFFLVFCACLSLGASEDSTLQASEPGIKWNSSELLNDTGVDPEIIILNYVYTRPVYAIWINILFTPRIQQETEACTLDPAFNRSLIKYQSFLNEFGSRAQFTTMLEQFEQLKVQFENVTEGINSKMNEANETIHTLEKPAENLAANNSFSGEQEEVLGDLYLTESESFNEEWTYENQLDFLNVIYRGLVNLNSELYQFREEVRNASDKICPSKSDVERLDKKLNELQAEVFDLLFGIGMNVYTIHSLGKQPFKLNPSTWSVQYQSFKDLQQKIQRWITAIKFYDRLFPEF